MLISCCFSFPLSLSPALPLARTWYSIHTSSVHYNAIAHLFISGYFFWPASLLTEHMYVRILLARLGVFLGVSVYACGYWWLIALNKCCLRVFFSSSPSILFLVTLASFSIELPLPPSSSLHLCVYLYRTECVHLLMWSFIDYLCVYVNVCTDTFLLHFKQKNNNTRCCTGDVVICYAPPQQSVFAYAHTSVCIPFE